MSADVMHCTHCGRIIIRVSRAHGTDYTHADGFDECPPRYASPRLDFT